MEEGAGAENIVMSRYEILGFIETNCDLCYFPNYCVNVKDNKEDRYHTLCRKCARKRRIKVSSNGGNFKRK